MTLLIIFQHLN